MDLTPFIKSFFGKEFENLPIPSNFKKKYFIFKQNHDNFLHLLKTLNYIIVQLHEPLSILQKCCEQFQFSDLLNKADKISDSLIRLAYVMAFSFAFYSTTVDRNKKPFTPFVGETYEFIDDKRGFKYFAEQVTTSSFAIHCSSKNFIFWNETNIKMVFWGKNIEFKPIGNCHIKLQNHDEQYIYTRPITSIENIMSSSPYIDNYGEMNFQNITSKQTGKLILKKRGFNNKNAYQADGFIRDENGNIIYNIKGEWNSFFSIIRVGTAEEIFLWNCDEKSLTKNPYGFSDFTKELNNLNQQNVIRLSISDSRFRSDQKALEYGLIDLAIEEHQRLQKSDKQKGKKDELLSAAKWFELGDFFGEKCFIFKHTL